MSIFLFSLLYTKLSLTVFIRNNVLQLILVKEGACPVISLSRYKVLNLLIVN